MNRTFEWCKLLSVHDLLATVKQSSINFRSLKLENGKINNTHFFH